MRLLPGWTSTDPACAGWSPHSFPSRLGEDLSVRLPSAEPYARQVEKEQRWLPRLAPLLPLPIPVPLAMGVPADGYPWHWSVYRWLEGESASVERIENLHEFATTLARFLAAPAAWDAALDAKWHGPPVWLHGDVSAGNLLVRRGRLSAVIDFGCSGVGDPACDLAIAWTLFSGESREAFRAALPVDAATWARGRGWALWKGLITLAEHDHNRPRRG